MSARAQQKMLVSAVKLHICRRLLASKFCFQTNQGHSRQTVIFHFSILICKFDYVVINQSCHSSQLTSGS